MAIRPNEETHFDLVRKYFLLQQDIGILYKDDEAALEGLNSLIRRLVVYAAACFEGVRYFFD